MLNRIIYLCATLFFYRYIAREWLFFWQFSQLKLLLLFSEGFLMLCTYLCFFFRFFFLLFPDNVNRYFEDLI